MLWNAFSTFIRPKVVQPFRSDLLLTIITAMFPRYLSWLAVSRICALTVFPVYPVLVLFLAERGEPILFGPTKQPLRATPTTLLEILEKVMLGRIRVFSMLQRLPQLFPIL